MKKNLLLLYFVLPFISLAQSQNISIVPVPVSVKISEGIFTLPSNITVSAPKDSSLYFTLHFLTKYFTTATGYHVAINTTTAAPTIQFILNKTPDIALGNEGYHLQVNTKNISVSANKPAGLFYAVQTLLQLFPPAIMSNTMEKNISWQAPCTDITDYPRFGWRGLMFDVSRHFFNKQEVKDFIDQMVQYKFNLLHLHLTDDEGWRIEIKSLPKLTSVGAWNVKKEGYFGTFTPPAEDEKRNNGGFYTQQDLKEIIEYAKERFVNIMPEVDVPGHSLAAIASYPELSCTPGAEKYHVNSGEPFMNWTDSGNIALVDNTLCPANEKVYDFLDKVFTEIAAIFPFEYIHVGGDECAKNFWMQSDAIKALMQKENLKTMQEVQSYFEKRVEKIVESKGKKFIGWDEILEGGIAPNAVVMSWRGIKGGIQAAQMGHQVVMSPTTFAYLDYMQGDAAIESHVYATLRLNKAYQFEPVPDGVDAKYIKGGQANLWTEQIYNMRKVEYMIWPRAMATAESVWSPKEKKNWSSFAARTEEQFKRLQFQEINYCPAIYEPIIDVTKKDNKLQIALSTEINGLDIYYSFDNSFPDYFYPKYTAPLTPPADAVTMKIITYRCKKQMGRMMVVQLKDLEKRASQNND